MSVAGAVGFVMAGFVLGYGLHLILSWSTVSGALETQDEYRDELVAVSIDLHAARLAARDAYQLGFTAGVRAHEDVN